MDSKTESVNESDHDMKEDIRDFKRGRCGGRRRMWKFIPIFLAVVAIKGALTMVLWNALIPDLFHGPVLDFWQAVGLIVLAKLVVGFHPGGGFGRFGGHHHHLHGRWARMSREEREKLREHLHGKM